MKIYMNIRCAAPKDIPGIAFLNANCKMVSDFVIGRVGDTFYLNSQHPHAREIGHIVLDMMGEVDYISDEGLGNNLYERVKALSNRDAADAMTDIWIHNKRLNKREEAKQAVRKWLSGEGRVVDPDFFEGLPGYDTAFLNALYHVVYKEANQEEAISRIFYYGFRCGVQPTATPWDGDILPTAAKTER